MYAVDWNEIYRAMIKVAIIDKYSEEDSEMLLKYMDKLVLKDE